MKIRKLLAVLTISLALTGGAVGAWHGAPQADLLAGSDNVTRPDAG